MNTYELCESLLEKLYKFSDEILELGSPILDDRLEVFERNINITLPFDFKFILKKHNGFSLVGTEVLGLSEELRVNSLDQVYKFEHYETQNSMPSEYIPFSADGRGNYYCLDSSRLQGEICPIIFWQHDIIYQSKTDVETCNNSFLEWVEEVIIDWTLEDYNYDGTEK